jgi:Icc-related predicted phosphoesterase
VLDGEAHAGCRQLRAAVIRLRPHLHVFGHVHDGYGTMPTQHTMFVNAALFGMHGALNKPPIVLDFKYERML